MAIVEFYVNRFLLRGKSWHGSSFLQIVLPSQEAIAFSSLFLLISYFDMI